jgi:hypothetical protein
MRRLGQRLTVRARLFSIATLGALLTTVVGGVGLIGYASLNADNQAEARLNTTQVLMLEVSPARTGSGHRWGSPTRLVPAGRSTRCAWSSRL